MGEGAAGDAGAGDAIDALARGVRAYVLLGLIAFLCCLPGLFSIPPIDRDESRFAQATAQMLETGDFVRIRLQDEPRNKKPIGIYWLQAASVALFSSAEAREIWAYRLPSALSAALAAMATFWAGLALVGRRAAFVGALLFAASVMLSTEGMIAKTDAALCAATALTMGALAHVRAGAGAVAAWAFWAALAAGTLIKGPVTGLVAYLTLASLGLWERRLAWARPLLDWRGIALAILIVAPWGVAIMAATQGEFLLQWLQDLSPKVSGGGEHPFSPPGLHLLGLPVLLFPATIGLAAAAPLLWAAIRAPRTDEAHAPWRFLLAWVLPTWLVFELATTKLAHYLLPVYPALALAGGHGLLQAWRSGRRLGAIVLFLAGGAGLVALCAWLATHLPGDEVASERRAAQAALTCGAMLAFGAIAFAFSRTALLAAAVAAATAFSLTFTLRERIAPEARELLPGVEATAALRRASPGDPALPLLMVGYREASAVFLNGTDTLLLSGASAGRRARAGQRALVEARERSEFERGLAARGLRFSPVAEPAVGLNYSNGQTLSLQPGVVSAATPKEPARDQREP